MDLRWWKGHLSSNLEWILCTLCRSQSGLQVSAYKSQLSLCRLENGLQWLKVRRHDFALAVPHRILISRCQVTDLSTWMEPPCSAKRLLPTLRTMLVSILMTIVQPDSLVLRKTFLALSSTSFPSNSGHPTFYSSILSLLHFLYWGPHSRLSSTLWQSCPLDWKMPKIVYPCHQSIWFPASVVARIIYQDAYCLLKWRMAAAIPFSAAYFVIFAFQG